MADATTPETGTETTESTTTDDTKDETATVESLQAEVEKWKTNSRKNEERSKENARKAKELDEVHKASMSDSERALAEATDKALAQGRSEGLARVVSAEVKAAAAGRITDVDALLEGLDPSKFLTDAGDVDEDAIAKWVDRIAPAKTEETGPLGAGLDLGQGSRQSTPIGDDAAFAKMLGDLVK